MNKELHLVTQKQAAAQSYADLEKNRKSEWQLAGISTGIHDLNLGIGGFIPQKVTLFAARSGVGKSALVNSFVAAGSVVRNNKKGSYLILSWEMSPKLFVTREICRMAEVTQAHILNGAKLFGEKKMDEIKAIYKQTSLYEVEYQSVSTDLITITKLVTEFNGRCLSKTEEDGIERQPIVIIDFIQMANMKKQGSKTYLMQELMVGIKNNANELGISYAILAQLQRETDGQVKPLISNLADSKSFEDNSDNVVLMHRPEHQNEAYMIHPKNGGEIKTKNKILWIIAKSRQFGTSEVLGSVEIKFFRFWSEGEKWDYDFHYLYGQKSFWFEHFGFNKGKNKLSPLEESPELELKIKSIGDSNLNH